MAFIPHPQPPEEPEIPKKRKPNKWQLFLRDCTPRQGKGLGMTEKVSACSIEYKSLKEKNPKKLEEIIQKQSAKAEIKKYSIVE